MIITTLHGINTRFTATRSDADIGGIVSALLHVVSWFAYAFDVFRWRELTGMERAQSLAAIVIALLLGFALFAILLSTGTEAAR